MVSLGLCCAIFVIVNLVANGAGRMIDEGINPRQTDRLFFWAWVILMLLSRSASESFWLMAGKLTHDHGTGYAQPSCQATRVLIMSMSKIGILFVTLSTSMLL